MYRLCCIGMHIKCWGPGGWTMLHSMAHGMPEGSLATPENTWQLLHLTADHLPCSTCASHFRKFLARREMPRTRSEFIALLNDAHNEVNARLGKRTYTLDEHMNAFAPYSHQYHMGIFLLILMAITLLCIRRA